MSAVDRARLRELHSKHAGGEWAMDENDGSFIARDGNTWKHLGETDLDGNQQHLAIEAVNALPGLLDQLDAQDRALTVAEALAAEVQKLKNVIGFMCARADADTLIAVDVLLRTPA